MRTASSAGRAHRRVWLFSVVVALVALVGPGPLSAQVGGTISGYVQDQGGGAMPGATVTAESAGQQFVRSTTTNATGFFDFQALPRGTYLVKVVMSGFETQVQKDVEVRAGANVRLDYLAQGRRAGRGSRRLGKGHDGGDPERDAVQSDRRPAGPGSPDERPQRRRAGGNLRRRHVDSGEPGHVRRPSGADHVGQRRQHQSQPVHAERLGVHALQPDDGLQPAAARRDSGDPDSDRTTSPPSTGTPRAAR